MTTKKLNVILFCAIFVLVCLNTYMNFIEIEALKSRVNDKQLLCKQVHEIKSKLNHVLECMEINKWAY
jgi:hypothetical protein